MLFRITLKGRSESHEGVRRIKIGRNHVKLCFWKFWKRKVYYNRDEFVKAEGSKMLKIKSEDVFVRIS